MRLGRTISWKCHRHESESFHPYMQGCVVPMTAEERTAQLEQAVQVLQEQNTELLQQNFVLEGRVQTLETANRDFERRLQNEHELCIAIEARMDQQDDRMGEQQTISEQMQQLMQSDSIPENRGNLHFDLLYLTISHWAHSFMAWILFW